MCGLYDVQVWSPVDTTFQSGKYMKGDIRIRNDKTRKEKYYTKAHALNIFVICPYIGRLDLHYRYCCMDMLPIA